MRALAQQGDDLSARAEAALDRSHPDVGEVVDLRRALDRYRDEVANVVERLSGRIAELDDLRRSWLDRRTLWSGWRRSLQQAGDLAGFEDDFARADRVISQVVDRAETAVTALAAVQEPIRRRQETSLALLGRIDDAVAGERSALLTRDAPPLLSAEHRRRLAAAGAWRQLASAAGRLAPPPRSFFEGAAWVILLQLALVLAAAFSARHFRRRFPHADDRWRVLLSHPWAIGLFVGSALTAPLVDSPPASWRLGVLGVLVAAACVLTSGMFRNPRKRRIVYVLAVLYAVLVVLDVLSLPAAAYRLVIAAAAAAGVPFLVLLARAEERAAGRRSGFSRLLWGGGAALGVVLLAQGLGFDYLSRWLLENSIATAFVTFTTVFLVRLGRGAIRAALQRPAGGRRLLTLRRVGYELSAHLSRGLEVLLILAAGLYVLSVWDVFDSPLAAWRALAAGGVDLGAHRLTLAQVALGALAVYLAFVASGVVRALVDEELGSRPEVEPGVADSVATLAHYALVVLGLFVALAALGFDLSSFAIVAGALGVGIGFGLQTIVNNFISGLILLFERPVRVGDVVVIDGTWATIRKIGLRATLVTTFDRSEIIVPNSDLVSEKVTNWTLSDKQARVVIALGVAYGSDLETVFAILGEVTAADPRVSEEPAPLVHFVGFGESSLDFEVRVWIRDIGERLDVRSDLLRKIDRRFREAAVTIPFPQRDVHLSPAAPAPDGEAEVIADSGARRGGRAGRMTASGGNGKSGERRRADGRPQRGGLC